MYTQCKVFLVDELQLLITILQFVTVSVKNYNVDENLTSEYILHTVMNAIELYL